MKRCAIVHTYYIYGKLYVGTYSVSLDSNAPHPLRMARSKVSTCQLMLVMILDN